MTEVGIKLGLEAKLPDGVVHLKKDRLVYTNLDNVSKAAILVTGYPEGPGLIATPDKSLEKLFTHAKDNEYAFIQAYLGPSPWAIKGLSANIKKAFALVEKKNTTLAVFSTGALGLMGLEIPATVNHVVFMSPMIGIDCIQGRFATLASPELTRYHGPLLR